VVEWSSNVQSPLMLSRQESPAGPARGPGGVIERQPPQPGELIGLCLEQVGGEYLLSVEDNGKGFDPEAPLLDNGPIILGSRLWAPGPRTSEAGWRSNPGRGGDAGQPILAGEGRGAMSPIRIMLADDHDLFREGLAGSSRRRRTCRWWEKREIGLEAIVKARELKPT